MMQRKLLLDFDCNLIRLSISPSAD